MLIFSYMTLLLVAGLILRANQIMEGTYPTGTAFVVEDVISLAIVYFGMIGLWGYARNKKFLSQAVWKSYFIFLVVTLPLPLLVSPKYQQVLHEHGRTAMIMGLAISTFLALPAYWGWYAYAFRRPHIWARPS